MFLAQIKVISSSTSLCHRQLYFLAKEEKNNNYVKHVNLYGFRICHCELQDKAKKTKQNKILVCYMSQNNYYSYFAVIIILYFP